VVVDAEKKRKRKARKRKARKRKALSSKKRSVLKKSLTGPTLLEMSGTMCYLCSIKGEVKKKYIPFG
jgi:hypothetical protein